MKINNVPYSSIWYDDDDKTIKYIDQTALPWELKIKELKTLEDAIRAIKDMEVRGAPLIGVTAAYGFYLGMVEARSRAENLQPQMILQQLLNTRPTAVNLKWALDEMYTNLGTLKPWNLGTLLAKANQIREEEIARSQAIGHHGLTLIKDIYNKTKEPVNVLTHCNAGWLACVDYGTATAPIYMAHDEGIPIHVWVDETRPRNQGARLTAYELTEHGVPCTVIPDNTGGHLMQNKMVDMVIVGTDRVAANGDVANKIGTYLKALAAHDNGVPFYVAMPYSTYDVSTPDGKSIPIEERDGGEVTTMEGRLVGVPGQARDDREVKVQIMPERVKVANYGFDITPAKYVTAYITEKGIKTKL